MILLVSPSYKWSYFTSTWVFPKIMVSPKWMVKIMENPIKMGWFGGPTPIFGNIHMAENKWLWPGVKFFTRRKTLPETNSSPLKIGAIHFQVRTVSFRCLIIPQGRLFPTTKVQRKGAHRSRGRTVLGVKCCQDKIRGWDHGNLRGPPMPRFLPKK